MSDKRDEVETGELADVPAGMLALDAQLCFAVYSAAHALNRTYKPLLDPYGLTYPQYIALMTLWEEDGRSVKALGAKLGLDSGTLSPSSSGWKPPATSTARATGATSGRCW